MSRSCNISSLFSIGGDIGGGGGGVDGDVGGDNVLTLFGCH